MHLDIRVSYKTNLIIPSYIKALIKLSPCIWGVVYCMKKTYKHQFEDGVKHTYTWIRN